MSVDAQVAQLRSLSEIAQDIMRAPIGEIPLSARHGLQAMAELQDIANDNAYRTVVSVRMSLSSWRTLAARKIKPELDTLLARYRAQRILLESDVAEV